MITNIANFISKCATSGINTPESICEVAKNRILEIDKILYEADKLRPEKVLMQNVIKNFGQEVPKALAKPKVTLLEDTPITELPQQSVALIHKICSLIETKDATSRDIMNFCGVPSDRDYEVYTTLKWLARAGIVTRAKDSVNYTKGILWSERPQNKGIN